MTQNSADCVEVIEYRPESGIYRVEFDATATEPSLAVISAIESIDEDAVTPDVPLYDAVDPDALDTFVTGAGTASPASRRSVTFQYRDVRVTVTSRGVLELRPDETDDQEATFS